jgi:hypothetical protein
LLFLKIGVREKRMITKILFVTVAFICIDLYGAVNFDSFRGGYTRAGGSYMSSGFPYGVHAKDCSPDTIRIEHITPILDIYEKNLRKGILQEAIQNSASSETFYLLSFVGDERFSSLIHDQYAERLFEEFGDKEASAVLLYYKTGGSLEDLRALYQQSNNEDVKTAIQICFFDASAELLEVREQDSTEAVPQPLSVTLSTQFRTTKYYTYDKGGEPVVDLFGGPVEGSEGDWTLHERTTDERDLIITYENTTENRLIRIEIPRYGNENCWREFSVARSGGQPVLSSGYLRLIEPERQFVTLYPGDNYIRKIDVNFSVAIPGSLMAQMLSDFSRYVVVFGGYWVGNAGDDFQVTLNYKCNYLIARSFKEMDRIKNDDWKLVWANPLSFDYKAKASNDSKRNQTKMNQERTWNSIMERWRGVL